MIFDMLSIRQLNALLYQWRLDVPFLFLLSSCAAQKSTALPTHKGKLETLMRLTITRMCEAGQIE